MVKTITQRPLDFVYFCFFLMHVPATLLVDLQALYPVSMTPKFIAALPEFYVKMSQDPLVGGAMGYFGRPENYVWFKSFLSLELVFQLPVFVLAMRGLLNGSKKIYLLMLIYAASTTTTTLPCLAVVLATPLTSPETLAAKMISVTYEQRLLLLSSYVPFFLIPLTMTVDMAFRILRLIQKGIDAEHTVKTR
ncbi:hypothetical protein PHLGIDRAFT_30164 [Phlebiopsis gigantea 11061_1 CR5-6]|uniref:Efficient mitochondria targeting-associated protein 19 n=1 Tax=Phlebiopsis gigantea (strain 11061_1 CR5-6) TaxID=745531 RepID=A0A0C3NPK4_PHLG1|nr:hypothetical protein PHLGIDRAFT_30164 [Phlebiopsis gigantea 11061_1 CR5-6]